MFFSLWWKLSQSQGGKSKSVVAHTGKCLRLSFLCAYLWRHVSVSWLPIRERRWLWLLFPKIVRKLFAHFGGKEKEEQRVSLPAGGHLNLSHNSRSFLVFPLLNHVFATAIQRDKSIPKVHIATDAWLWSLCTVGYQSGLNLPLLN